MDESEGPSRQDRTPEMFDRIAGRYDLLNRMLSFRRDVAWRNRLAARFPEVPGLELLDVATGTGDVLLTALTQRDNVSSAVGVDPAGRMLALAARKVVSRSLDDRLWLARADSLALPFADGSFDVITIAFGIRNVIDVNRALREMKRVLRTGGKLLILEFSLPSNGILRRMYLLYFRRLLPRLGAAVSGDDRAYRYLNESVETFPYGRTFCEIMESVGFGGVQVEPLTCGVASIYSGCKY